MIAHEKLVIVEQSGYDVPTIVQCIDHLPLTFLRTLMLTQPMTLFQTLKTFCFNFGAIE